MRWFLFLLLVSCSFNNSQTHNQTAKGHEELYSEPDSPSKPDSDYKRIVIAGTNDIQGFYEPLETTLSDGTIQIGGKDVFKQYVSILRDRYKNVLLLDAGGVLPKDIQDLEKAKSFYQDLQYDAVTIGIDDFNLQLSKGMKSSADLFRRFSKDNKTPLLLSNLYDLKTALNVDWEGSKPYILKEIDGVKVGILGLVPDDLVQLTPVQNRVGLFVEDTTQSALKHARLLRSLGAQIIVVLTHQGIDCSTKLSQDTNLPATKVNFEPNRPGVCDLTSPLGHFLERLPPRLVDVVIGGRINQKMANVINGTVVLGGQEHGKSLSYVELMVNRKSQKVEVDKTIVHQPVYLCSEFFEATNDCYPEDSSVNHKLRTKAEFLGEKIVPPAKLSATDAHFFSSTESDVIELLKRTSTDVAFIARTYGGAQLVEFELSGNDLGRILEEDVNESTRRTHWKPAPYKMEDDTVEFVLGNEAIKAEKIYKVLSDLESLQQHHRLRKLISRGLTVRTDSSWNSLLNEDVLQTSLAAPVHQ